MRSKEREEKFDPSQPALIVTYGNTTRRHRALKGDLVVIGRSSCCDVGLVSPEVAPIHCVIVKIADGWRIRDCTGRGGTHVNGKAVCDEPLHDGDTLQVGTFSFQLNLPRNDPTERLGPQARTAPAEPAAPAVAPLAIAPSQVAGKKLDEARMLHLQQSRERLARHALNLRRRLRTKKAAPPPAEAPVAPSHSNVELEAKRVELEQREEKYNVWQQELTEQDRSIREEYRELEQQRQELQEFTRETLTRKQADLERKAEATLAERQKELDRLAESLQAREHDLERERQQLEENALRVLAEKKAELAAAEQDLEARRRAHEEQLHQAEQSKAEMAGARVALQQELDDVARMRELAQAELEAQTGESEQYLDLLWQQCEAHRRRVVEQHGPIAVSPDVTVQTRALDGRSRELASYARHLRKTHATLTQYEQELAEAYQQFHEEYEKAVQEAQALSERAAEQAEALRRQAEYHSSCAEPTQDGWTTIDQSVGDTIIAELQQEVEQVQAEFTTQLAQERERADKAEDELNSLQGDLVDLHKQLQEREEILDNLRAELSQHGESSRPPSSQGDFVLAGPERLTALIEQLQKGIVERDGQIRELQRRLENLQLLNDPDEKEAYEAELNSYRVELERDRQWLNEEIARLQGFKAEIDEMQQEEELRISHERAEIAAEWAEINRIREQLRRDAAKVAKSDNVARERLKAKQTQTKTEAVETTPLVSTAAPPPQQDLISRLSRGGQSGSRSTSSLRKDER
jgi:chromosome segregation ATPase